MRFVAGASVMIKSMSEAAIASFSYKVWGYFFGAIFLGALSVSLLGCSDSKLSPGLLLGDNAGAAIGSDEAASGFPGNIPGYVVGIQIRD